MNKAYRASSYIPNNSIDSFPETSLPGTSSATTDTGSTSYTIPGPGALSGKAILALGKATLRGAEALIIRRKFQIISSKFPHRDEDNIKGIERMYEDILELSRRDFYSDVTRTRALHMIIVQIGSEHVEKLVRCLTTWHDSEHVLFLSELFETLDPLCLAKVTGTGDIPSLVQVYQSSLDDSRHGLVPFVLFLQHLILASEHAAIAASEAGVVKFLAHVYILGFSDPLAVKAQANTWSQFRLACDLLLDAFLKTKNGSILFVKDRLHVLWPLQPGSLLFNKIPDRSTRRMEIWRSMETRIIDLRIQSILNMMLLEDYNHLLEQDSLDDIASDILEFSRDNVYHEAAAVCILEMSLTLIGSYRTKELVYCISTWPTIEIQTFVFKLMKMFNTSWLGVARVEENFHNPIQTYHQHSIVEEINYFAKSVLIFLEQLVQNAQSAIQAILGGGVLDFLLSIYLADFRDPLTPYLVDETLNIRMACDSLLHAISETEQGSMFVGKHEINFLWPPTPTLQFTNTMLDQPARRMDTWRSMDPERILSWLASMLYRVWAQRKHEPDFHPFNNVAINILEFLGYIHPYPNKIRQRALKIIFILVGTGRTDELIYGLETWPQSRIVMFLTDLKDNFVFRNFRTSLEMERPRLVWAYYSSLTGSEGHVMEPLLTFCRKIVQGKPGLATDVDRVWGTFNSESRLTRSLEPRPITVRKVFRASLCAVGQNK